MQLKNVIDFTLHIRSMPISGPPKTWVWRICPIFGMMVAVFTCMPGLSRFLPTLLAATILLAGASADAQTIVIDPGHGGSRAPGATGCGLVEAHMVLDVSTRVASLLRNEGLTVLLTRSSDTAVSLGARSSFANARGAARFVSIHANANTGTPATGIETFISNNASSTSRRLGTVVQANMVATWRLRDRGLKVANFSVIRRTTMPGILAEIAFINRCDPDARLIGSPSERGRIARAIAGGIMTNLGRTLGGTTPAPEPEPEPMPMPMPTASVLRGVIYQDIAGSEDTSTRLSGASVSVRGRSDASTTGSDGAFRFTLPTGNYTLEVRKSGFATQTRACTVSGSGESWCSVGLRAASSTPTQTTIRGIVYENQGGGIADANDHRISAARVFVNGGAITTDSNGIWSTRVNAGDLDIQVSKSGFETAHYTCTASGSESWCSVGLVRSGAAGQLRGVVYRQGSLSTRIQGADVSIDELTVRQLSADRSGYWSFDLPPGTYTVRIQHSGYLTQTRTCEVTRGNTTWCSIAVAPSGRGGGEAEVIDERAPEEAAYDGDGAIKSGGCNAGGTGSSTGWMFLLLGLVFWRRQNNTKQDSHLAVSKTMLSQTALVMAVTMMIATAGCTGTEAAGNTSALGATAASENNVPVQAAQGDELLLAQEVPSFARIEDMRVVTQGDYVDLELSPTGEHIALSHSGYQGISIVAATGGDVRVLREATRAGYEPVWRADGLAIGVRVDGQTSTATPILALTLDGQETSPISGQEDLRVSVNDEDGVVLRRRDGDLTVLAPAGDRYFEPRISNNGEFVAFRGLASGLYVHRVADGATFMVGAGSHVRFSTDSHYLVFERVDDDGHTVLDASIFVMDLQHAHLRYGVIEVQAGLVRAPSLAGQNIAFARENDVMVGRLVIR